MRQENKEGNNYLYLEECGKALRRKCHSVGLCRKNSSSLGSQAVRWNSRQRERCAEKSAGGKESGGLGESGGWKVELEGGLSRKETGKVGWSPTVTSFPWLF